MEGEVISNKEDSEGEKYMKYNRVEDKRGASKYEGIYGPKYIV